jgi:hypothetical protein
MISSASPHKKMIIGTLLAGAMVLVALWMLAISPKRAESASVKERVVTEEQRLATAQTQLAAFKQSRAQYGGLLAELKRLDEAVPARGAISDLLRQLQKRANVRNTELRVAALKPAAAAAPGAPHDADAGRRGTQGRARRAAVHVHLHRQVLRSHPGPGGRAQVRHGALRRPEDRRPSRHDRGRRVRSRGRDVQDDQGVRRRYGIHRRRADTTYTRGSRGQRS